MEKYTCPCCGYKTLNERGTFEICEICFWEDDLVQFDNADDDGGPNLVSLRQAQINFNEFGACEREMLKYVRKPYDNEKRDPNWTPIG